MLRLILILPTIIYCIPTFAKTIVVGKNQSITTIRKAVEIAKNKDSILVLPGIYKEGNIVINKSLTLAGQNFPILDGENKYEIFTVSGSDITIKGFQFQNSGSSAMNDYASVKVIDAKNIFVENNKVINAYFGIHFMFSHYNSYFDNTFNDNGAGVAVMYSHNVTMERNTFEQNWGASSYGILLKDISDSRIQHNSFLKNSVGIHMEGSSRIEISQNIFKENGWAIKVQASCDDNNFYQNNFYGNSFEISTNGTMMLNKFYNNYWDKYEGYDRNKDGIGDVPYHPVSMYSMIVEENPNALILLRSFMVSLLDKAEKAIPSLTPENLIDDKPMLKPNKL